MKKLQITEKQIIKNKKNLINEIIKSNIGKIVIALFIVLLLVVGILVFIMNNPKKQEKEICVLEYNVNGGTSINSLNVECGLKIDEPTQPIKEGFEFLGWYSGNEKVNFDKLYLIENLIIEAKWKVKENTEIITIKFDSKGGTIIDDIEIAKGSQLATALIPKKEGYLFKYWSYNNQRFDFITKIDNDITLVAVWEKEENKNSNISNSNNSNSNNNTNINNSSNSNSNNNTNINDNNGNFTSVETCTYEIKDLEKEYNGKIPEWSVGLEENEQFSSYYGFWSYNPSGCNITYKSENASIATVSTSGSVTGKNLGSTYVNICVVDKNSNEELDCFKWKVNVHYSHGSKRAIADANNLVNAIDGYYWYLDGYEYAYIKVNNIDWYDHKCLDWTSKYIELENNKFITTEDTGTVYYSSSNIHNKFLVNPTDFAYDLIQDYNMHVSSNKLYITLGSKTYSFTKETSEKIVKAKLSVNNNNITIGKGEFLNIDVNISPLYASYGLNVSSSNSSILSNCSVFDKSISCYAKNIGNTEITIIDKNGAMVKVDVKVQKVNVSGITLSKSTINLLRGDNENIIATVLPSNAETKTITWSSSNSEVAIVNSNGNVTAKKAGFATITATTVDGEYSASCTVIVTNPTLSGTASIGVALKATSTGTSRGVSVTINPTGGTGVYNYYKIKIYKDGTYIGENTDTLSKELFLTGYINGTYKVEFEIKDSDGNNYTGEITSTISGF